MNNGKHKVGKSLCFLADGIDLLLINLNFPHSSKYAPNRVFKNKIRPNKLWLIKWLIQEMDLKTGMKVLDMGYEKFSQASFLIMNFINNLNSNYLEVDKWISGNIMI